MAVDVSVVISCFNAQDTIDRCIASVLSQSFENFEIIVVDDASTDDSLARLRDFADARLRIIELQTNSGSPAEPRNVGIQMATGRYIAFLDSDDYWHPDKLQMQMSFMMENRRRFTCTDYVVRAVGGAESVRRARSEAGFHDLISLNSVGCSTVMVARELLDGLEFRNRPQEDLDMWLRILKRHGTVHGLHEPLTVYVKRANSRSRLRLSNILGFHALLRSHCKVGHISAAVMMVQYFFAKRSQLTRNKT